MSVAEQKPMVTVAHWPSAKIQVRHGRLICGHHQISLGALKQMGRVCSDSDQPGLDGARVQYHRIDQPDGSTLRVRAITWRDDTWYEEVGDEQEGR